MTVIFYWLIAVNMRTGRTAYLLSTPLPLREAAVVLSKQVPRPFTRFELEPAS